MTNAEIIFKNRVFLMEQEVIKGIEGTHISFTDEQGTRDLLMPEEIRTFDEWKKLGYIVQKGQHAIARFQIWMPKRGKAKVKDDDKDEQEQKTSGFYKKTAFFFTIDQCKPIEKKEDK